MGTALLFFGLTLLSCIGAIRQANYSDLLASASQVCTLEVKLRDGYGDGWNGNSFQLRAGPSSADYPVPLSPLTQLCATSNNSYGDPTIGTLLDSDYCSFTAQIPSGWNIEMDFFWTWGQWPDENYITTQLSYVQPFFGPVNIATSKFRTQTDSTGQSCQVPFIDPVFTLICGPVPSPVSAVTAAPNTAGVGARSAETIISWTPVIAANSSVAFAVSVLADSDDTPRGMGIYTGSSVNVLLKENMNYLIVIKALNAYGESAPTSFSYRTHSYITAQLDAILFATRPSAWMPDGRLAFFVNNAIAGIATILDASSQFTMSIPYVASGDPQIISVHFVPPTGSAGETSFRVIRSENKTELFNSGQTAQGPKYYDGTFNVSHPKPAKTCGVCCLGTGKCSNADPEGYCCDIGAVCCKTGTTSYKPFTCCAGAQKCLTNYTGTSTSQKTCAVPVATCPDTQPVDGASCYGVLACSYNSTCCCPGDATDQVCGPTVKYQCTGENGATWVASTLSLPCQNDPNFVCPSQCPASEPSSDQMCLGSKTCVYGKTCCCPSEPDPANQICTMQKQLKCSGVAGGCWQSTSVIPAPCPALCYSQTKAGTCPTISGTCTGAQKNISTCQVDAHCNGTLKCCAGSCGNTCVQPCDCSSVPSCQPWEKVAFTAGPGCCGGTKSCVTDPDSTQCPTAVADWTNLQCVLPASQTCGAGTKTRTVNVRDSVKGCLTSTQNQACNVPCPVDCAGSWSACGACSSTCRGGTCTRTFKITTQPANGGKACNSSDGAVSAPEACPNLPPCPLFCPIRIVVKDWYGDGWTYSTPRGFVNFYDNTTNNLLVSQQIDKVKTNFTNLLVASGTVLKIVYTKDKYYYEDIIQIVQNDNNVPGSILYQDPMDISKWGNKAGPAPQPLAYFTVKCNDCSLVTPSYCLNVEKRQPCSIYGSGSATNCGACAPGYTLGSNVTGPCVDMNECAMSNNLCALAGAACSNTEGSFTCTCPKGTRWSFGYCETPGVCPPQRFRMEWFDMSPKQRQLYHDAYKCLYDTGMYQTLWTLHSAVPGGQYGTGYPSPFHYGHDHGSGFYYWHRAFSLRFEDMVRQCAIIKNITELRCFVGAYWDSPSMLLAANSDLARIDYMRQNFFTDAVDADGNHIGMGQRTDQYDPTMPFNFIAGGPPNFFQRGPDSNASSLWPGSDVQWGVIASASQMSQLTQIVTPHFAMHPYIGGAFGGVESARDPFFFLHHNYYDQLWETWKTCRNKNNWADAAYGERWYANNAAQDYNPDGPMQGWTAYPQDVWDNANIIIRQSDGTLSYTSVVYSSSSVTRAQGSSYINCPNVIGKYFKSSINDSAVKVSALELPIKNAAAFAQKRSFVEAGGRLGPKVRVMQAVEVPPAHLWHTNGKQFHPEANTEWREHLRRLTGGAHTAEDRHVNVLAHTWRAPKSYLGRAAWLQTATMDTPTTDIGQQCRQMGKKLSEDPTVDPAHASLAVLDCECDRTDGKNQGALPSETVRQWGLQDLCQYDGCQISQCARYQSLVHGRDDDDGSDDTASTDSPTSTDSPASTSPNSSNHDNAQSLIARLGRRGQTN